MPYVNNRPVSAYDYIHDGLSDPDEDLLMVILDNGQFFPLVWDIENARWRVPEQSRLMPQTLRGARGSVDARWVLDENSSQIHGVARLLLNDSDRLGWFRTTGCIHEFVSMARSLAPTVGLLTGNANVEDNIFQQ